MKVVWEQARFDEDGAGEAFSSQPERAQSRREGPSVKG